MDSHFVYHLSSKDRKVLGEKRSKSPEATFDKYVQKKHQKITDSVLYSTFSQLTHSKNRHISSLIDAEKIASNTQKDTARSTQKDTGR